MKTHIHVFNKLLIFFCDLKTTTCYFFVLHLLSYILHNLFAICIIFGTYGVDFPNPLLPISIVQTYTLCTTYFQSLCTQATVFSSYLNYYSKRVFLLHDEWRHHWVRARPISICKMHSCDANWLFSQQFSFLSSIDVTLEGRAACCMSVLS